MTTYSTNIDWEEQYQDLIKYIDDELDRLEGTVSLHDVGRSHQRIRQSIFELEIRRSMWK